MYFAYIVFLFPLSSWVMLLALRLGIVYTVCLSLSVHCGSLRSGNLYAICLQLWCSPGFPLWLGCWWHSHQGIKNSFWAKRKSLFYVFGGYATIVIPPSSLFTTIGWQWPFGWLCFWVDPGERTSPAASLGCADCAMRVVRTAPHYVTAAQRSVAVDRFANF